MSNRFSKIDVAEAQLTTAIRLFFDDAHPIAVHTLACAAREIMTTLGVKLGRDTLLHDFAEAKGIDVKEAIKAVHVFCGFMKHADRDPAAMLEGFSDFENDALLWVASHDFGRITGGMPVEAQVFEAWFYATNVGRVSDGGLRWQRMVRKCIRLFPRVRSVGRNEQKRIGRERLSEALQTPSFVMEIKRVVELPGRELGSLNRGK